MKHLIVPVLAALLCLAGSPVLVTHGCGLSSWPIEWLVAVGLAVVAFLVVHRMKRPRQKILVVVLAPMVSFGITFAYGEWLHSEAFPDWLLDRYGKECRAMTAKEEPIPVSETTRGK